MIPRAFPMAISRAGEARVLGRRTRALWTRARVVRPVQVALFFGVFVGSAEGSDEDAVFPVYVGRAVCLECHSQGHTAVPCTLRPIPEHGASYAALSKPQALDIAALSGVPAPPERSRICLDCHSTAADEGPRWTADTFKVEDGVQCEACHGAGSFHVDEHRPNDRQAGYPQRAGNNGATSRRAALNQRVIRRGDRLQCATCHVERPSHREVLEYGFALSAADRLYKTPVNLAISPDGKLLYVVCEHSNSVCVVDPIKGRVVDEVRVGKRPHDVAVSPDGRTVYVTNRLSNTLSVIDAKTRKVARRIPVGHEPHGVLPDPTGRHLFVLNTGEDTVSVIDAVALVELKRLVTGRGPWSLTLRPDGASCVVTSVRPTPVRFRDPPESEMTVIDVTSRVVVDRLVVPEANMLQGVAPVPGRDVVLFTMMRTKHLVPLTRLAQGWTITNGLGIAWSDGRVDQVLLDQPDAYFADPTDVAVSPDGRHALVTSGGADLVALIDVAQLLGLIESLSDRERDEVLPNHLGRSGRFVVKRIGVGANPRGVLYSPDGRFAYVVNSLDDSVTVIDTSDYRVTGVIKLGGPDEVSDIRRGERLFHSAGITYGGQFSCRSCHPDGHVNGLSFDIEADGVGLHPVDNRTLRGILDTPPFKWEGTNPSLSRQCGPRLAVFFTRLAPYTPDELAALVRYMCTIERPPNRHRRPDGLTLTQRRGKAVFERATSNYGTSLAPEQRCAHCHSGAYKTNRLRADVGTTMFYDAAIDIKPEDVFKTDEYGELGSYYFIDVGMQAKSFDAPHLRNVYQSAPYLHNGAAGTLEEIWTRFNMTDRHGMTGDLTRRQFNDLIAYLKSL